MDIKHRIACPWCGIDQRSVIGFNDCDYCGEAYIFHKEEDSYNAYKTVKVAADAIIDKEN